MGALTLHEASKLRTGVVKGEAIIRTFEESSPVLRLMPFRNIAGDAYSYNVEESLPNVGYRGYNEGFSTDIGIINPQTERLSLIGMDIDVDRRLVMTRGPEVRAEQERLAVKGLGLRIARDLVHGDTDADPRQFDGLRKRVTGDQLMAPDPASPGNNGPLKVSTLMAAIDNTMNPVAILMPSALKRRLQIAAYQNLAGYISIDQDEFGYRVTRFDGLPIYDLGHDHENKKILDFNEAGPAGGNDLASVYVISFGGNGVVGLQNGGIMVDDLGEIDTAPVYRTRLEWMIGMAIHSGKAVTRIWGVQDADVVQ
jgi:hypothetical protein